MQLSTLMAIYGAALWSNAVYGYVWEKERHPTFFASGASDTKIQVSLQQELLDNSALYFAYTLRGLWLRDVPSTPFKELMHRPEIYWASAWGELGYEHLSNGVDNHSKDYEGQKQRSRSLQRLYWQDSSLLQRGPWQAGLKLMAPVFIKRSTPYHDYLGYGEGTLAWRSTHATVAASGSAGRKGGHVTASLSLNPLTILDKSWASRNHIWVFLEYFHGNGETLIDYERTTAALRLGLRLFL